MDQNNLARVFGPTIVGHSIAEPSPTTIMKDTTIQPKVCLKELPASGPRQIHCVLPSVLCVPLPAPCVHQVPLHIS
uniref:Rho-GAP domain-containing protein n=1 Tax=Xiphophorus couchianus TaxID=32473 RepID=A0A3B5KVU6_9TELE